MRVKRHYEEQSGFLPKAGNLLGEGKLGFLPWINYIYIPWRYITCTPKETKTWQYDRQHCISAPWNTYWALSASWNWRGLQRAMEWPWRFQWSISPRFDSTKKKYLFKNVASRWKRLISQPDQKWNWCFKTVRDNRVREEKLPWEGKQLEVKISTLAER